MFNQCIAINTGSSNYPTEQDEQQQKLKLDTFLLPACCLNPAKCHLQWIGTTPYWSCCENTSGPSKSIMSAARLMRAQPCKGWHMKERLPDKKQMIFWGVTDTEQNLQTKPPFYNKEALLPGRGLSIGSSPMLLWALEPGQENMWQFGLMGQTSCTLWPCRFWQLLVAT